MDIVIVYGPQGIGKSTNAKLMQEFFFKTTLLDDDDWTEKRVLTPDTLVLCEQYPKRIKLEMNSARIHIRIYSLREVKELIGDRFKVPTCETARQYFASPLDKIGVL